MDPLNYLETMFDLAIDGEKRGIWFWAAIYTFAVCCYSALYQVRVRSWPQVRGDLLDAGLVKFGATEWALANQEYVIRAGYRYRVAGVEYTGKRVSPWLMVASHNLRVLLRWQIAAIQRLPDGGIRVFYNPRNPRRSFLVLPGRTGIGITLAIALLPLVAYWGTYHG